MRYVTYVVISPQCSPKRGRHDCSLSSPRAQPLSSSSCVTAWWFVHPALSKWDYPILSSLPCWTSSGLGKRLAMTYGVTQRPILPLCSIRAHFFVSSCSYPQGWCCFRVTLLRCQNCYLALSFFIPWSDWRLLYLLSFHHLWHGQSFPEYQGFRHWGSGCDFPYWLICICHSRVIICLVFYCWSQWSWRASKGPQAVQL